MISVRFLKMLSKIVHVGELLLFVLWLRNTEDTARPVMSIFLVEKILTGIEFVSVYF